MKIETTLLVIYLILDWVAGFEFASIKVQPDSKIINTVTRYKFTYDRTKDDNIQTTSYSTVPIIASDTATVTFPNTYTLGAVTCSVSVNGGTPFTPSSCTVSGFKIIATGIVSSNTILSSLILWVNNILNPSPAIITDYFYGTIGSDTSGIGTFASTVELSPAAFQSCYVTFSPTTVNSTADMIFTIIPTNSIGSSGSIVVQFPTTRRWTNDISTTNYLPISTSMSCSNKSANVKSTFQCIGDLTTVKVTASNLFNSAVSTTFSFSINNFLSPPTEQPTDAIKITSFISGSQIDTCSTYVSGLSPKPITGITITNSNTSNSSIVVNRQYTIRFTFTITDVLSQSDTMIITLPSGSILSFSSSLVSSTFSILPSSATYDSSTLSLYLYMQNQGRTFSNGTSLVLSFGTYTAPPSTQTTQNFVLSFYRNGFIKMQGTTTLTASPSTVSGSVTTTSTTVNANTSYSFTITTIDPITSAGKIKIILPNTVSISTSSATCASVSGSGMALVPVCSFNSSQNSITLSSLNSSSSNIIAQTITITINGIRNPSSTSPTSTFSVLTYYRSTDASLVAIGFLSGITATTGLIDSSRVVITSSSYIVNDQSQSYSVQLTVVNPIPAGGYFTILIPSEITVSPSAISGQCSININSTSYVLTSCSATSVTNGVLCNFSNPFTSDLSAGSVFIARISSVFTNPSSTRPTSSFALDTYHSNGYSIASISSALSVQMNTADSFQSTAISRSNSKNYQLATYTFTIKQKSAFQTSSVVLISFPSNIQPTSPACQMILPTSTSLSCSYSSPTLKISLPASVISSSFTVSINVTNIRNPASFAPSSAFTFQTKTSGELYLYSYGIVSPGLVNNIASAFDSLTYTFTPSTLGQPLSLKINFDPSNSGVIPNELRFTFANSFTIQTLSCNSFVDFIGSCSMLASNTISVTGSFTSALMSFSITGFTSPLTAPSDYSSIITFDSAGYKLDESVNSIIFVPTCTLPCRTCTSTPTQCVSCYNNTLITSFIYFDSTLKNCYQQCVDGKYENATSYLCLACDSNCLTCQTNPTFCTTCNSLSQFKYLNINTTLNTQVCVSTCPSAMYPDTTISPTTCKSCVSPCLNCTTISSCLSCRTGYFYYSNQCLLTCPSGIAISNSVTNNCDFCDSNCLTCINTTTTCISCNQSLLLYQSKCLTTCPSPLVPQNGTCGACDSSCKTCANNPYNCTSCNTNSTLPYLYNNLCLSQCPETYYKNIGAGVCSLCSSVTSLNCNNCSSVSTCKTCNVGFVYFEQSCLNYVPVGYVNISGIAQACTGDCATCSITTTNCTTCKTLNYFSNQCLTNCPSGYTPISKICTGCLSPCRTCQTTIDTCTSCLTTLTPSVYLSINQCVETCPNGTYGTKTNYTCANCQSPCYYCTSATTCTSCVNGFFLEGTSCTTVCQTGYLGLNGICQICLGNCATCQNSTTTCTSCKTDFYYLASNNSCVTSCGTGLYIDYLTKSCISCSSPCKTCTNTSDTCLSCTTGVLFNHQCLSVCPDKYFIQSNQCNQCPQNCSSCISLVNCTGCALDFVLYNGFCITQCPSTHSVVISSVCTKCSTSKCHKCSSADFCFECQSTFSLHNGACLGTCPSGFQTNGTHCIDTNQQILTSTVSFPIPFSIATIVVIIACMMSRLQYNHTFLSGALYSLIGLVQAGALGFFIYLYFINYYVVNNLPFFVAIAALCYLYLLNVLSIFIQNCSLYYDRDFKIWYRDRLNKVTTIIVNVFSLLFNHKIRNILFCKFFSLSIFSAKLQSTHRFKMFNIFSFLSLLHSGAAIFAAASALKNVSTLTQTFYACIDVIVATGLNSILAFFNILKGKDYFYQKTTEGFDLKKKINIDDDYYQSKIEPAGKAAEDQEGFTTNIYRVQAGTGFTTNEAFRLRDNSQFEKDQSFGSLMENRVQQVSIQAVQQIPNNQNNDQFSIVISRNDRSGLLPRQSKISKAEISIQSSPFIQRTLQQKNSFPQSKGTQRTVFYKQHSYNPNQVQDSGVPKTGKTFTISKSKQKQRKKIFDSSSQQANSQMKKNILYKPNFPHRRQEQNLKEYSESNQKKNISIGTSRPITAKNQKDEIIQSGLKINKKDEMIQNNQQKFNKKGSKQSSAQAQFNTFYESQQQIKLQPNSNVIFEEENQNEQLKTQQKKNENRVLNQNKKDQLLLPKQQIQQFQKQLQQKIKQKDQKIDEIKKTIQKKQKFKNQLLTRVNQLEGVEAGKLYKKNSVLQNQKPQQIREQIQEAHFGRNEENLDQQNASAKFQNYQNQIIYQEEDEQKKNRNEITENQQKNTSQMIKPQIKQQLSKQFSGGQYTSGNDVSTRFNASTIKQNPNKANSKNMQKVSNNELENSQDEKFNEVNQRPIGAKILNMQTDLSDAYDTGDLKKNKFAGQYSQRLQREKSNEAKNNRYDKSQDKNKNDGRNLSSSKPNQTKGGALKIVNRFEFEQEQKNISSSGQEQRGTHRINRAHLIAPFETDKQQTQFRNSKIKSPQKILHPRHTIPVSDSFRNEQVRKIINKNSNIGSMQFKPSVNPRQQSELQFGSADFQDDPYIQQQDSIDDRKKVMVGFNQMADRPDNDQLRKYYEDIERRKRSKEKKKKKINQSQIETQKIYLQRQDLPKKWK